MVCYDRRLIMKTTKTFVLAALTALSFGAGIAMAQETPTGEDSYWSAHERSPATQTTAIISQIQSGSAGAGPGRSGAGHNARFTVGR
jgi:hypothetical protein